MVEGGRQPLNDQRAPLADAAAAAEGLPSEPERSYALLVFVTGLSLFNFGYNTASISGALLYIDLDQTDCSAEVVCLTSAFEKGCVVSSVLLGACLGALSGGPLGDRFGRSRALIYNNAFYIIGPVGMALSQSVETLAATRALTGFGVGVSSALVHLYIGESVPAARRGEYGALLVMLGSGGVLVANLVAYALGDMWRLDLGLSAAPALLQVLLGPFWLPESPAWLMKRHQHSSSSTNFSSGTASTSPALVEPSPESPPARASTLLAAASPATEESSWLLLWKALRSGEARVALGVGAGLQLLQQISGINVAVYYGPKIFTLAHFSKHFSILLSSAVSLAQLAATLLLALLVDKVGRRIMALIGCALMAVSLIILGLAFCMPEEDAGFLALTGVLIYRVAFSISLGPLPYIITAEIFPAAYRAPGVSLCWAVNWLSNFGVSLTFLPMLNTIGDAATFFIYAGVCLLAMVFVWACVPETNGVSMDGGAASTVSTPRLGGGSGGTGVSARCPRLVV